MKKVILTVGLPGSGKSTWANKIISENKGSYVNVNRDDLRSMLHNSHFSKSNEKFITKLRDQVILDALESGKHVIVSDTNLNPKVQEHIKNLVKGSAKVEILDFTHVPLEDCIRRDLKRLNSVGKDVIERMYNQYLVKREFIPKRVERDESLPSCIIVDIDGTLAHMNGRGPFNWKRVGEDLPDNEVIRMVNQYKGRVILMSGRDGVCKPETVKWLTEYGVKYNELHMRTPNDMRKDNIIKDELYTNNVLGKYKVDYVVDDRDQVVDMWRELGLLCVQVARGAF